MFTADQARAMPLNAKFQRDLERNESHLRGVASIENATELAHHRQIGVLIYDGGDTERMAAEMKLRGFSISSGSMGSLRAHW